MAGPRKAIEAIQARLTESLDHPLTASGSESLARSALAQFPEDGGVLTHFARKIRETFAEGLPHDTLAVPPGGGVAVWFLAWPGTPADAVPARRGEYLEQMVQQGRMVVDAGIPLRGLLEIDAYVLDADPSEPDLPALQIDYSFLPGDLLGGASTDDEWKIVVLNQDLCTPAQRERLEALRA